MPNIYDHPELYDVLVLGGVTSPGVVRLSGHDRKATWDVQMGPFLNGARTILKGVPPISFRAAFFLVRDDAQGIDDFAAWPAFAKQVASTISGATPGPGGKRPTPLDIYHPDLAANDIRSVAQASIGGMQYDDRGGAMVVVEFQEYRPPRPYGGTPISSKKDKIDPNADVKRELDQLTKQNQKTPWG